MYSTSLYMIHVCAHGPTNMCVYVPLDLTTGLRTFTLLEATEGKEHIQYHGVRICTNHNQFSILMHMTYKIHEIS